VGQITLASSTNEGAPASPAGFSVELIDRILERLRAAHAIQVAGHIRPDGDCIGSMLAFHHLLDRLGLPHALAAEKMPANGYHSLKDFDRIEASPSQALNPDLTVYLDCATLDRGLSNWTPSTPIINIDHHGGNTRFGQINWVDDACAATGQMVFYLIRRAGVPLSREMAESLLVALTTDTGSFRFSNTGAEEHRIAAELIEAGASPERVSRIAYGSNAMETMRLTGYVLTNMRAQCDGRLIWSEIRRETYRQFGGEEKAAENLADMLRNVRGAKLSLLFHELEDGAMRLNLRSNGEVNVAALAARWGGGGHPCASGLHIAQADYESLRDQILQAAREMFEPANLNPQNQG
jgi:phosphoesterase RecJ-like protein